MMVMVMVRGRGRGESTLIQIFMYSMTRFHDHHPRAELLKIS